METECLNHSEEQTIGEAILNGKDFAACPEACAALDELLEPSSEESAGSASEENAMENIAEEDANDGSFRLGSRSSIELVTTEPSNEQMDMHSDYLSEFELVVDFSNANPFNCQSCGNNIDARAGIAIPECGHEVCTVCLVRSVADNQTACPYIVPSSGLPCYKLLSSDLVRSYVSETEFQRYTQEQLNIIDDLDVIPNSKEFDCSVCLEKIAINDGIVIRECVHEVCRACLRQVILHSQDIEIKCPFMNDDYSCDFSLQQREIHAILDDQAAYDEYLARTLQLTVRRIPNAFYCKTVDCEGFGIHEDDINLFECPICLKINCINCRAIHEGLNCKQYQDWKINGGGSTLDELSSAITIDALIASGEAMRCPKCKIILMKKEGCDALICGMCTTDICWVTRGPRWGPAGRNDPTGGCHCKVNGKLCHPQCRNCH